MNIIFTYPSWFVLLCVLAGVIYSALFYRKDRALNETPQWLIYSMSLARFSVVTILALLLLKPLVESESQNVEKPIILVAVDNSESVLFNKDSSYYLNEFPQQIISVISSLSEDYEVQMVSFGDKTGDSLWFDFTDKQTDMSELLEEIESSFFGRNLGAVIIAGDGLFNKGLNPLYANDFVNSTTVYTIALGDTNKKKDLIINAVAHNKLAYLGNDFPLEVVVNADYLKGEKMNVAVFRGEKMISSQTREIVSDNEIVTIPFKVEADISGKQIYSVRIDPMEGEFTALNNRRDIVIEVLDNQQEILIITAGPHPDIAAIRNAIEKNINYKVTIQNVMDYKGDAEKYNLAILHQVPSTNGGEQKLLEDLKKNKIPTFYFLGSKSNYASFNQQKIGLTIVGPKGVTDAKPALKNGFSNFTVEDGLTSLLPQLPPVQIPFANDYQSANGVNVLFNQKIGSTTTDFPLIGFNSSGDYKVGFFLGEGIWRWKFQDFIKNGSNQNFEDLVSKMIQYLAVKEDKSKFRVFSESEFLENEKVIFNAELYNDIYELVNNSEVNLLIVDQEGRELPIKTFSKAGQSYRLDAGVFGPGSYKYIAQTTYDGEKYEVKGEFIVKELKVEYLNTVANHNLLYSLSEKTGGRMYSKDDFSSLPQDIDANNKIAAISYVNQELTDVIKWPWILALILVLLSIEWFLRKRFGAY